MCCYVFVFEENVLPQFMWFAKSQYAKPLWIFGMWFHCFKVHSHMFGVEMYSNRNVYISTCQHSSVWHRIPATRTILRNENLRNSVQRRHCFQRSLACDCFDEIFTTICSFFKIKENKISNIPKTVRHKKFVVICDWLRIAGF